ncbi:hypothetical protein F53441_10556 [Fusarium austroafricanum]|uniref:Alcohol acetyltransferase n=1 Tax=Fusarium austroafricanum TaxID=2364996 RepID=A0A8H4K8I6_9HYPO|nr:hypothetical protein F53441_10556 [Fusarium austroafricanum]
METKSEFLRYASPNEMRTIAREDVGYYHAVIIGAVYNFTEEANIKSPSTYFQALRRCIEEHPFFCVTVGDKNTDKAYYERVSSINVEDHISIVEDAAAETNSLEAVGKSMRPELDRPFVAGIPPWRIVVLPLGPEQCHIAFCFSHTIGDGIAGVAFHKTFLAGLRETTKTIPSSTITPPAKPLPEPFDTKERLPISWSFLLAPFVAEYVPYFLVQLFGLRVSAHHVNEGTWTAAPIFFNPEAHNKLKIRQIGAAQVNKVIQLARSHNAKLTGVMHQLIARALSKAVKDDNVTNFVSQTAVNMRRSIGMSNDVASNTVSGGYTIHPRSAATGPLTEQEWASAAEATKEFAMTSTKLEDNAIGLLRYAPSIRKWTLGKIGKKRDSSYEFSNVGVFDGSPADENENENQNQVKVTKLTFAQPGHVGGCPISFNVASVKGGDLVYTVTWQPGALGLGDDAAEEKIVEEICDDVQRGFNEMA